MAWALGPVLLLAGSSTPMRWTAPARMLRPRMYCRAALSAGALPLLLPLVLPAVS